MTRKYTTKLLEDDVRDMMECNEFINEEEESEE